MMMMTMMMMKLLIRTFFFRSPLHSVSLHWRGLDTRDERRTFRPFLAGVCTMVERDYVSHSTRDGPHFVAASSVQGALAGTQSLDGWWGHAKKCVGLNADDEQIAMHVHEQQWRHWALIRWKRQVRSRWHCHQVRFARRMLRWTYDNSDGSSKNAIPLPLGSASLLLGTDNTYKKNTFFLYSSAILDA